MIRHPFLRALPLTLLVVVSPLPFASISLRASTFLFLGALVALVLALFLFRDADPGRNAPVASLAPVAIACAALAAIGLFGWLQAAAWPGGLVRAVAPQVAAAWSREAALPGLAVEESGATAERAGRTATATATAGDARAIPLSLAPRSSRLAAIDWWLPAAAGLAAAFLGSSRRTRRVLLGAFLASAAVQIAIGVQLWISRSDSLWGRTLPHIPNRLRGSFVNPNHLALYLEIALALAFAWLWWSARRSVVDGDSAERRLGRVGPPALVFLFVFAGLVLTSSRAGVLAAVVALAVQGIAVAYRGGLSPEALRRRRLLAAAGGAAAIAALLLVGAFGVEGSLSRFAAMSLGEGVSGSRFDAAAATLDLWALSPITGVGLGAFRAAFPLVQPATLPGLWRHAHSDWAELLATTGLVGAALLGIGFFVYLRRLRSVIAYGEKSEDRAAGIAAVGALVAVGLHSLVDFGLTMPANAFALAVVAGAAAAAQTREAAANNQAD